VLKDLFDEKTLDNLRVEDLRKLNELLQKQPRNSNGKPITWAETKPAHKP
jgi:hypothetical protein